MNLATFAQMTQPDFGDGPRHARLFASIGRLFADDIARAKLDPINSFEIVFCDGSRLICQHNTHGADVLSVDFSGILCASRAKIERPGQMTPEEFKAARNRLGLTQAELGRILDTAPQTVRKWEMDPDHASTARGPNPVACQVMRWMLSGFRPPEWPQGKP